MNPNDTVDTKETHTLQEASRWPLGTAWVSSYED